MGIEPPTLAVWMPCSFNHTVLFYFFPHLQFFWNQHSSPWAAPAGLQPPDANRAPQDHSISLLFLKSIFSVMNLKCVVLCPSCRWPEDPAPDPERLRRHHQQHKRDPVGLRQRQIGALPVQSGSDRLRRKPSTTREFPRIASHSYTEGEGCGVGWGGVRRVRRGGGGGACYSWSQWPPVQPIGSSKLAVRKNCWRRFYLSVLGFDTFVLLVLELGLVGLLLLW